MGPTHVENVTDLAVRTALSYRGVAHLTIPTDFQEMTVSGRTRSQRNVPHHTSDVVPNSLRLPQDVDLERAAAIMNEGEKIVILAGRGALKAGDELEQMAEMLGAPIIKALLGKGCVPDDSPYTTQGIGLLGTSPSQDAMEECDTILIVGSSFPYLEYMPKPTKARGVQIDLDPKRIGLRFPVEVGLLGDSTATLKALMPFLKRKEHRAFLQKAQKAMKTWNEIMLARSTRRDMPMKPQVPAHEVGIRLREDAITTCDSGTVTTWWARQVPAKRGQMHSLSGTLASMACALPYAIGAQVAFPERQVVSFVGDGGFSMLMADFVTAVKYKLPIKVVVFVNSSLGQIKWEQIVFLGNPEFAVDLASIDFAQFAQACGGKGFTVDDPKNCAQAVEQFLAARGPAILQAIVDPNEPPLPGKATLDQALKFAEALARGEKDAGKILKNVWSDKVREMV
jgi:pyruvate dehydrogenase (quinone)/pyruvate oxidase